MINSIPGELFGEMAVRIAAKRTRPKPVVSKVLARGRALPNGSGHTDSS